jgi:hypothetical protein
MWNDDIIGSSTCSNYIPYYVSLDTNMYEKVLNNNNIILFRKPTGNYYVTGALRYDTLINAFYGYNHNNLIVFDFKIDEVQEQLYVMPGLIMDRKSKVILMMLVKEQISCNDTDNIHSYKVTEEGERKHKLFISLDFIANPIYKNVFKRINKDIIQSLMFDTNVDVIHTRNNLTDLVYKNDYNINHSTVTELDTALQGTEIRELITFNPVDYHYHRISEIEDIPF